MGDNNDKDAEKFTILYFLHSFVLSNVETVVIPRLHFDLVDSGRFKDFSWNSLSFEDLARCLNNRLKACGKFYLIKEMPLAIQVPSSKMKKEKKTARIIFPQVQSKPDSHVEEVEVSKPESYVEKEAFISKKVLMHSVTSPTDGYAGVEISPQQFSSAVDQNLGENQKTTKGCTDLHLDKTNIEIDSQHLIPDELLQSINLDYNLSEKIVHHDVRITDEKMDQTNLSDSQFTIRDELLSSLNTYQIESITTDSTATREEEPNDEHFNDKKFESIVQDHCQIEKLAGIIPLCFQQSDFYVKKGIDVENHSRYKDKDSSDMFDVLFQENLPQQSSERLDCGLYMITYVECLSYGHKVLANEFDFNALRKRYTAILWDYGIRKQDANAHSDVKAPLRPARQSRISSVTEVFDV
ncbi:hypothetical protein CQW23_12126 [Capsicum baccatum]|uniref:Ubiquitin-like protease family profile domain-containing protein n=1 Tax=Capsicum baccatum TaxID=33114 RepID=A0A2G2WRM8_CAPBA|nr:hypothetical protein CQW23_12126 [Capsicum baccatum]